MTRINTNVSSLNAQKTLARSNNALQESLTRLSTGLRINKGKDDPAGLIASEVLRADITSVERAITNSSRANQMIATADSALGQVSGLLNDIRGLISEAANSGALSDEQIAANQLQIDSSLEAIDRISQVTAFQGQRLLDGNLDFLTENVNSTQITDLNIEQANFGALDQIDVSVKVAAQATQASLNYGFAAIADDVVLEVGGKNGFEAFSFESGATITDMAAAINLVSDALGITAEVQTEATKGALSVSSFGENDDIVLTAATAGYDEGNMRVKYTANRQGNGTINAAYTAASGSDPGTLDVQLQTDLWTNAVYTVGEDDTVANNAFTITALKAGADYSDYTFNFTTGGAAESVTFATGAKEVTIHLTTGSVNLSDAITLLGTTDARFKSLFSVAVADGGGTGGVIATGNDIATDTTVAVDGGAIVSTANEVVTEINTTPDVEAALATGDDGYGVVGAFQESAYYGTAAGNNRLQFLGVENAENVRFVSTPGASLGVDTSTEPTVEGFASAVINLGVDQSTIQILARSKGAEFDGVNVKFAADTTLGKGNGWAVWDEYAKELTIYADTSSGDDVDDILSYINSTDKIVSDNFRAVAYGSVTGTNVVPAAPVTGHTVGTLSGGLVSEGTVIVNLATTAAGTITTTAQDLVDYFDATGGLSTLGISVSNAEGSTGAGLLGATTSDITFATTGQTTADANASVSLNTSGGINSMITITADIAGTAYDGVEVVFDGTAVTATKPVVSYDATMKKLSISIVDGVTKANEVMAAINGTSTPAYPEVAALFTAAWEMNVYGDTADSDGTGVMYITDGGILTGGTTTTGTANGTALLGNSDEANTGLTFTATEYGSDAFVSIKALNGTSFAVTNSAGTTTERSVGTDIDARINGVQAVGNGLSASLNTSALDLNLSVGSTVASGTTMAFSITGGGAQFQLGPDVVSNQQARMGISSVNTAKLGGTAGRLFELRSGKSKSLANDVSGAASVAEEVIGQIVNLRGRLGAFQRTTLDTNIDALSDTLEALTAAQSDLRDADFAAESANLTRAQVLVQSGLSVLSIANSNPQSVLSLLR